MVRDQHNVTVVLDGLGDFTLDLPDPVKAEEWWRPRCAGPARGRWAEASGTLEMW